MITKQSIEEAPMFTVFKGAHPVAQHDNDQPRLWGVFGGGRGYSTVVEVELERRELEVGDLHIECVDEVCRHLAEPYDDLDAAIDALNAGYTLVKVPDVMVSIEPNTHYCMYVLNPDGKSQTRSVIWYPPSTVHEDPLFHAFEQTGTIGHRTRLYKSACGEHVIHATQKLIDRTTSGSRKCSKCRVEVE